MKAIALFLLMFPFTSFATPSALNCDNGVSIQLLNRWIRSSYIGVTAAGYTQWFDWTGNQATVSGNAIKATRGDKDYGSLEGINAEATFQRFAIFGDVPVFGSRQEVHYLYVQTELFEGAKTGQVVTQTQVSSTGALSGDFSLDITSKVLNCSAQ